MLKVLCSSTIFSNISSVVVPLSFSRVYSKDAVLFGKLINKAKKKRYAWRDFESPVGAAVMPPVESISRGPQSNKRVAVLNKLFMKHITDIMSSGASSEEIAGLGIEVTRVKVAKDYSIVNVYWTSNAEETQVSQILNRTSSELRQELTGLHVMGKVPLIKFKKDRSVSSWASVEAAIKIADMGDDYVPRGIAHWKSDFGNEKLTPQAGSVNDLPNQPLNVTENFPPMRQNVLGLDRSAIIYRIKSSMKGQFSNRTPSLNKDASQELSYQSQFQPFDQEAFASFLLKRKIDREKALKATGRDSIYIEDELDDEEESTSYFEEEDYLEDEDTQN